MAIDVGAGGSLVSAAVGSEALAKLPPLLSLFPQANFRSASGPLESLSQAKGSLGLGWSAPEPGPGQSHGKYHKHICRESLRPVVLALDHSKSGV